MGKQHNPTFLKVVADAKTRVNECSIDAVLTRQRAGDTFTLVDVREDSEYAAGHIPGAVHAAGAIGRGKGCPLRSNGQWSGGELSFLVGNLFTIPAFLCLQPEAQQTLSPGRVGFATTPWVHLSVSTDKPQAIDQRHTPRLVARLETRFRVAATRDQPGSLELLLIP